jgi:RNA-directed DNA polymerase
VCESGSEQVSYADNGVPQGGPISPIIFNIVMNGIDQVIMDIDEQVYPIRYADDLYVFGNTWNCVNKMKEPIKKFLKARGLKLNEAKTKIVEVNEGIDFLGYNIKEYID